MTVTELLSDVGFYLRAIDHGAALFLIFIALAVRSLIRNEPLFSW